MIHKPQEKNDIISSKHSNRICIYLHPCIINKKGMVTKTSDQKVSLSCDLATRVNIRSIQSSYLHI